jgi:hypothetical protein
MLTVTVLALAGALAIAVQANATALCSYYSILRQLPSEALQVSVTLVLAATGPLVGIEALLDRLLLQTLRPGRLIVCVESHDDPAYQRIAKLVPLYPALGIELAIAGVSGERAQKCTNLLAGFARIGPDDPYIVWFDADILPPPWWLAALIGPLAAGHADLVGGYRWQVPRRVSPATILGAAVDRAIATLWRPNWTWCHCLWGGSVGLTWRVFEAIDMPRTLSHALTEDLAIDDRAAALRLRVLNRGVVRVPTPLDAGFVRLFKFARRQYQIIRGYRRRLWWYALAVTTSDLLARIAIVLVALWGTSTARPIAITGLFALGLVGSATVAVRGAISRRLGVPDPIAISLAFYLVVWSILPIVAFHAAAVWTAIVYSPVVWSHVRYTVGNRGEVLRAEHSPHRGT